MISILNSILLRFSSIVKTLNNTPIKRLLIYAMLIYPVITLFLYRDEIKFSLYRSNVRLVKIHDLASAQERCFKLREKHNAEAVMLYIYQPATKNKDYKERIIFSSSSKYKPMESTRTLQLSSRSRILEELKDVGFSKITTESKHYESPLVDAFNLRSIVITPIRDTTTDQIIGEVAWCFTQNTDDQKIEKLINAGQIFAYDISEE